MTSSTLARRYAKAIMELADEQNALDEVGENLSNLLVTWNGSDELRLLFENPAVGAGQRRSVLEGVTKKMSLSPIVGNALMLLSDRRRMRHLPEVVEAYRERAEQRSGRVRAEVTTAGELPEKYFTELQKTLESVTGKKVTIVRKQDESLIAGVVARVGDKVFDGSLRNRLDELKESLLA